MQIVYKYPLDTGLEPFDIVVPWGSEILGVGLQDLDMGLTPVVWYLVDKSSTAQLKQRFLVVPTGVEFAPLPANAKHLGTAERHNIVVHFFQLPVRGELVSQPI